MDGGGETPAEMSAHGQIGLMLLLKIESGRRETQIYGGCSLRWSHVAARGHEKTETQRSGTWPKPQAWPVCGPGSAAVLPPPASCFSWCRAGQAFSGWSVETRGGLSPSSAPGGQAGPRAPKSPGCVVCVCACVNQKWKHREGTRKRGPEPHRKTGNCPEEFPGERGHLLVSSSS